MTMTFLRWLPSLLCVVLAPFTTLKFFHVQAVELLSPLILLQCLWILIRSPRTEVSFDWDTRRFLIHFQIFLLVLLIFSAYDTWHFALTPFREEGLLRRPYWVSVSRIFQLLYASCLMILVWNGAHQDAGWAHRMAWLYRWVGILVSLFGIANYYLAHHGLDITLNGQPPQGRVDRAQGTFIEPGPFGVYLVSLLSLEILRMRLGHKPHFFSIFVFVWALALTASKAAAVAIALLIAHVLWPFGTQRWGKPFGFVILLVAGSVCYKIAAQYIQTFNGIPWDTGTPQDLIQQGGYTTGRFMAIHLLPKMFIASPLTGIGIGNYPLLRESPLMLEGRLPHAPEWDLHGMGLLGVLVELGLPLFTYFLFLVLWPLKTSLTKASDPAVKTLLGYPLVAFLCGLQIHFVYPWLFIAIASSLAYHGKQTSNHYRGAPGLAYKIQHLLGRPKKGSLFKPNESGVKTPLPMLPYKPHSDPAKLYLDNTSSWFEPPKETPER